jgi:hypothetical protein
LVWIVVGVILLIIIFLGFSAQGLRNENGEEFPMTIVYLNLTLMIILFLLLHNFKIKLSTEVLEIKCGIGILKKSFKISEIDRESIRSVKPYKCHGIGWRYNFKGDMIFNAKYGTAVCFKLKENNKKYYIVANDQIRLKNELEKLIPKN